MSIKKNFHFLQKQTGQSLIEILVAIGLMSILLPALLTGMISSREGKAQESQRLQAVSLTREATEAVRSVREKGWSFFANNGIYHPTIAGSSWSLLPGSETVGSYTRQIIIADVQRDNSGNVIASGGIVDPSTKLVSYLVSWTTPVGGTVSSSEYLTRYLNNNTLVQTSSSDFNLGTHSNTHTVSLGDGAVELLPPASGNNFTDDYNVGSNYNFDANKIEVLGGFAELKAITTPASGSTLNPDFTTNLSNWTFSTFNTNIGQSGSWVSSGGNPGGYVQINFPKDKSNSIAGGYFYQAFTTTPTNPTGTLTFQWRVTNYQPTPDSFHLYAFVDTTSGAPTLSQNVWDSGPITSTTGWSGTVTVDVSSKIATAGTYYLKIAGYVDYPNANRGPYTIGFDNVLLSWSGNVITGYPSDSPTIDPKSSFAATYISSWNSFVSSEVTNGGSIRYQLSYDNGATWKFFKVGSGWITAVGVTDYNDATTINSNIASFSTTNNQIKVKAFLIGNGNQFVKLDQIIIDYSGIVTGTNNGVFTSGSFDAGSSVAFNRIYWSDNNTVNTTTKFQIATNTDNSTWNYVGPDGTSSTYFTAGGGIVPLGLISGRYLRYKTFFTSTNGDLPNVTDVTINYSP